MLLGPMIATSLGTACKLLPSYQLDFYKTSPYFSKKMAVQSPEDAAGCWPQFSTTDLEKAMLLKLDADPSLWSGQTAELICLGCHA